MRIVRTVQILLTLMLMTACSPQPAPIVAPGIQETAAPVQVTLAPTAEQPVVMETVAPAAPSASALATAGPNCLGDEVNPLGQSIAQEYEFTNYEQVMTWYCNGAEFEDILAALETESQTASPAGEMLKMLAAGSTWEEIWQNIGLTK